MWTPLLGGWSGERLLGCVVPLEGAVHLVPTEGLALASSPGLEVGVEPPPALPGPTVPKILTELLEWDSIAIRVLLFVGVHMFSTLGTCFHLFKQVLQLAAEHLSLVQGLAFYRLGHKE